MILNHIIKKKEVFYIMLITALVYGLIPKTGIAMPVDSQFILCDSETKNSYVEKIQFFLNRGLVEKKLSHLGLSRENINKYILTLDEIQLKQLADRIDSVQSAGDSGLIFVLILLLLVVSILYLADYRVKLEPRRSQ